MKRNGARRLLSFWLALVMTISLAAAPAAAAEETPPAAENSDTVTPPEEENRDTENPPEEEDESSPEEDLDAVNPPEEDLDTVNPPEEEEEENPLEEDLDTVNPPEEENLAAVNGEPALTAEGEAINVQVKGPSGFDMFASDPRNTKENLIGHIQGKYGTLTGTLPNGKEISLSAKWHGPYRIESSGNGGGPMPFDPKGFVGWAHGWNYYEYKATLTPPDDGNYELGDVRIRIYVNAVLARQSLNKTAVTALKTNVSNAATLEDLGLPTQASITYEPCKHEGRYTSCGQFPASSTEYTITRWKMKDGTELTLDWLKSQVQSIQGNQLDIELTPVYGNAPEWATVEGHATGWNYQDGIQCEACERPTLTLTIFDKVQADVTVTPPADIRHNDTLGDPSAAAAYNGSSVTDAHFMYEYEGVGDTKYPLSEEKPTDAGTYRVKATLIGNANYGGVGYSAPFTIGKADYGEADATIRVSPDVPDSGRYRHIDMSDSSIFPQDMTEGAKIILAKSGQPNNTNFIKSFRYSTEYRDNFSFSSYTVKPGTKETFTIYIESRNYVEAEITFTILADYDDVTITGVKVNAPGVFPYGTKPSQIFDLTNCKAAFSDGTEVRGTFTAQGYQGYNDRSYPVGLYGKIVIRLESGGKTYQAETAATYEIKPAKVTFPSPPDNELIPNGYHKTIYASNADYQSNSKAKLLALAKTKTGYNGRFTGDQHVSFKADWTWDSDQPNPDPKGSTTVQYRFTADLKEPSSSFPDEMKNFDLSGIVPKAYITVLPVAATPVCDEGRTTSITEEEIGQLTNIADQLGLPREGAPCLFEYKAVGDDKYVEAGEVLPDSITRTIQTWQILRGDSFVPLNKANLQTIVAEMKAVGEGERMIQLAPAISGSFPAWATQGTVDLTIKLGNKADVTVTMDKTVTYGEKLEPSAAAKLNGAEVSDAAFTYVYEGTEGTQYDPSPLPPTDLGTYKVTARLTAEGCYGEGSADFTIVKAESGTAKAYISLPSGSEKIITIDGEFIPSHMAKGATIKETLSIDDCGDLIESCTALVGAEQFTLKAKAGAANGSSQEFELVLTSYGYETVTVTVIVYNDTVVIDGAKLKGDGTVFEAGTALEDIIDLTGCSATVNGDPATGTFALMDPTQTVRGPNKYEDWSVTVTFTTTDGKTYQVQVSVPDFTVKGTESGGSYDDASEIYLVIYADSGYNVSADHLLDLVRDQKPTHNGTQVTWRALNNRNFQPKGLPPHGTGRDVWFDWYNYAADGGIKAYVSVIPVKAALSLSAVSTVMEAAKVKGLSETRWKDELGLPTTVSAALTPDEIYKDAIEKWTENKKKDLTITGWKMEGKDLTLSALKAKAGGDEEVIVTLTPTYDAPWATITGAAPTFTLTITPKTLVSVEWNGPASNTITYGETLNLKPDPSQAAIGDGGTDSAGTWDYVYYKDGTKLSGEPKDAGIYKVQAVLKSETHSGTSELRTFEIKPKSITSAGFTFTSPAGMDLTYNKQPKEPVYTVKDGEKELVKDKDYTVKYTDNINAGTAKVTFTGKGNYSDTKDVTFTIEKLALTEDQKPTISGTAAAGQVLSASLSGVDAKELEWIWTVDGKEITGYTAPGYEVKPTDSNKEITVQAKAKADGNYSGESAVSDGKPVAKFTVTGTVSFSATNTDGDGKIAVGTKLTASVNVVPEAAETGGTWSWKVNGTIKEGVTISTYIVEEGDKEIVAVFTPNSDYTGTLESAVIEVGKIPLSGMVTVASSATPPVVDSTLTASVENGPVGAEFIYTWLQDGTPITDASGDEYTITAADRGKTISVKVTAEGYTGERVSNSVDIPAVVPGKPSVTVKADDKTLDISWTAPADNGGAPITGYKLTVTPDGESALPEIVLAANVTSYKLENLTNGTKYTVSVIAVNSAGESEAGTATGTPKGPDPVNPGGGDEPGGGDKPGGGDEPGGDTPGGNTPGGSTDRDDDDRAGGGGGTSGVTTQNPDGSTTTVETKRDGTVVVTIKRKDGSTGTTSTDSSGQIKATVRLPSKTAGKATGSGSAVSLPVQGIRAPQSIDRAPVVIIETSGVNGVKVNIPVVNHGPSIVAVRIMADGTGQIIKNTVPTQDGIAVRVNSGDTLKILDNRKTFADMKDHWAADAVAFVTSRELFLGTTPNTFSPNAKMTRGMLVTVLARYDNVNTEGGAAYYEKGAAWAVTNGLSDGSRMDAEITREQLVTILYRYCILKNKLKGQGADLSGYQDADQVGQWARDAMSWAVGAGLLKGTTPTTLDPKGGATRAQVAVILMRYAETFGL